MKIGVKTQKREAKTNKKKKRSRINDQKQTEFKVSSVCSAWKATKKQRKSSSCRLFWPHFRCFVDRIRREFKAVCACCSLDCVGDFSRLHRSPKDPRKATQANPQLQPHFIVIRRAKQKAKNRLNFEYIRTGTQINDLLPSRVCFVVVAGNNNKNENGTKKSTGKEIDQGQDTDGSLA